MLSADDAEAKKEDAFEGLLSEAAEVAGHAVEQAFEKQQQQERADNERCQEDCCVGRREEGEGEDAGEQERRSYRKDVWDSFLEQASEACLGMGFQTAAPEREGASCGGVGEEEGNDEVSCLKKEGECGCSYCEGKDKREDGEGSAVRVVHDLQTFGFGCS